MPHFLFINTSANREGTTASFGEALLDGLDFEKIDLIDFRIGFHGQNLPDDEFDAVFDKVLAATTVVLGSPIYTDTMSAGARAFLERLETHERAKELAGRSFAFFIQGFQAGQVLLESTTATVKNAIEPQGMRFLGTASDMVELAELREAIDAE